MLNLIKNLNERIENAMMPESEKKKAKELLRQLRDILWQY